MSVMNYRKGTGAETSWIIEETSFHEKYTGKCESIFTQGNPAVMSCGKEKTGMSCSCLSIVLCLIRTYM